MLWDLDAQTLQQHGHSLSIGNYLVHVGCLGSLGAYKPHICAATTSRQACQPRPAPQNMLQAKMAGLCATQNTCIWQLQWHTMHCPAGLGSQALRNLHDDACLVFECFRA